MIYGIINVQEKHTERITLWTALIIPQKEEEVNT